MTDLPPKRRWFRFYILAVHLVAVLAIAALLWQRADLMQAKADDQMKAAASFWQVVDGIDRLPKPLNTQQEFLRREYQAMFEHHAALSESYRQAAWRPWTMVRDEPLPPTVREPEGELAPAQHE